MPRIALVNMIIGFAVLTCTVLAGAFLVSAINDGYLHDRSILESWSHLLQKSAHGHSNLFGILHVVFGLTLPYSVYTQRIKIWQTAGLSLGTFAMGPLLVVRSILGPTIDVDMLGVVVGSFLSLSLISLASHTVGMTLKFLRHP